MPPFEFHADADFFYFLFSVGEPKNASTNPDFVFEHPTEAELEGDLGHSMDGASVIVGRHVRRTLASFSMTDKVRDSPLFSSIPQSLSSKTDFPPSLID